MIIDPTDNTIALCARGVWVSASEVAGKVGISEQEAFDLMAGMTGELDDLVEEIVDFATDQVARLVQDAI